MNPARPIPALRVARSVACALLVGLGAAQPADATGGSSDDLRTYTDQTGDAVLRLTDPGRDGPVSPTAHLPDIIEIRIAAWSASDPLNAPYAGTPTDSDHAHLFRIDVVFDGLLNQPGPLGGGDHQPFLYGPSPVYGYIEIDVDSDRDTGGELDGAALNRYLANVGRFGEVPSGSIQSRAATSSADYDGSFFTGPQYERSGADFAIALCGCFDATVVSEGGDADGMFEAGETWVLRSRYWQRAGGYRQASGIFGGSDVGLFDPWVNLRFRHDTQTDRTTITLVEALDPTGAAMLRGEPAQPIDQIIDGPANAHHSLKEALLDLVYGAEGLNTGPLSGPVRVLTEEWDISDIDDALKPRRWDAAALVATPYADPTEALFAWTDAAFDEHAGDFDGDDTVGPLDEALFFDALSTLDGSPDDADGLLNGVFLLANPGPEFSVFDLNNDGAIDESDIHPAQPCPGDWNTDAFLNDTDFFDYVNDYFSGSGPRGHADFNADGFENAQDFFDFVNAFFTPAPGCL